MPRRHRILPNVILGGVQKSGTTSAHWTLDSHPEIFLPPRPQELHYFDDEANYARGIDWYAKHFRDWNGQKVVAQTSPLYIYLPEVPGRIHAALGDARLVFLLRNPVDRAHSHYWHEVRYGWEDRTFEQALALEAERLADGAEARRHYSYVDRGRYADQLDRFRIHFPRERILLILLDDWRADRAAVCERLGAFLDVDPVGFTWSERTRVNRAHLPRWPRGQRLVARWRTRIPKLARLVDRLNLRPRAYPAMKAPTRARLQQLFEPERDRLEREWGLDLSRWRETE